MIRTDQVEPTVAASGTAMYAVRTPPASTRPSTRSTLLATVSEPLIRLTTCPTARGAVPGIATDSSRPPPSTWMATAPGPTDCPTSTFRAATTPSNVAFSVASPCDQPASSCCARALRTAAFAAASSAFAAVISAGLSASAFCATSSRSTRRWTSSSAACARATSPAADASCAARGQDPVEQAPVPCVQRHPIQQVPRRPFRRPGRTAALAAWHARCRCKRADRQWPVERMRRTRYVLRARRFRGVGASRHHGQGNGQCAETRHQRPSHMGLHVRFLVWVVGSTDRLGAVGSAGGVI